MTNLEDVVPTRHVGIKNFSVGIKGSPLDPSKF